MELEIYNHGGIELGIWDLLSQSEVNPTIIDLEKGLVRIEFSSNYEK